MPDKDQKSPTDIVEEGVLPGGPGRGAGGASHAGNHSLKASEPRSVSRKSLTRPKSTGPLFTRTEVNFVLDLVLLLNFLVLAWISVVLRFVFPRGTAARGWTLWGLGHDDVAAVQFVVVCTFALTILVHVMLHWSWVCGVVAKGVSRYKGRTTRLDDGGRTLYGVGLLILLLNVVGLCIAAAALSIQPPTQ